MKISKKSNPKEISNRRRKPVRTVYTIEYMSVISEYKNFGFTKIRLTPLEVPTVDKVADMNAETFNKKWVQSHKYIR